MVNIGVIGSGYWGGLNRGGVEFNISISSRNNDRSCEPKTLESSNPFSKSSPMDGISYEPSSVCKPGSGLNAFHFYSS